MKKKTKMGCHFDINDLVRSCHDLVKSHHDLVRSVFMPKNADDATF